MNISNIISLLLFLLPATALSVKGAMGTLEILILCLGLGLWPVWRKKQLSPVLYQRSLLITCLVFLAYFLLTILSWLIFKPSTGVLESPFRLLVALLWIPLIVCYQPNPKYFLYGVYIGIVSALLLALQQVFVEHIPRAAGFTLSIVFGNVALLLGVLAILLGANNNYKNRLLTAFIFFASLFISFLSGARGGWLMLPFALYLLYGVFAKHTQLSSTKYRSLILFVLSVIVVLVVATMSVEILHSRVIAAYQEFLQYFSQGHAETSIGARLEMWYAAYLIFMQHPIFGIFDLQIQNEFIKLAQQGLVDSYITQFRHVHNEILNMMVNYGMVGALLVVSIYGAPLLFFMRVLKNTQKNAYALAGIYTIIAYFIFGLTQVMWVHHIGIAIYGHIIAILIGFCLLQTDIAKAT